MEAAESVPQPFAPRRQVERRRQLEHSRERYRLYEAPRIFEAAYGPVEPEEEGSSATD